MRLLVMILSVTWILNFSAVSNAQVPELDWEKNPIGGSAVSADDFADGHRYTNLSKEPAPPLVIDGATLIDGTGRPPLTDARIVIVGDKIQAVGRQNEVKVPEGAQVIDARGKVVMPGLIDSHAHYRMFNVELHITHGVTTQLDTGNYMDYPLTIRELAAQGRIWGPRVFTTGSGITGVRGDTTPKRDRYRVSTPEEARAAADAHVQRGVDFIKVYDELEIDQLRAITEVAHKAGLKVVGHIGAIDAREAALAGMDGLIHALGISAALVSEAEAKEMKDNLGGLRKKGEKANPWGAPGGGSFHWNMDESKFDELIKLLVDRNVMIQPDIVHSTKGVIPQWVERFEIENHRLLDNPGLHYIRDNVRKNWLKTDNLDGETPEDLERRRVGVRKMQDFLVRFVRAGGLLLAGSDTQGSSSAGLTLHHELEVFVDMGLTPMEAILTATKNPAEFYLPGKGLGILKAGNFADLLILTANPLDDIRNIRKIEMVMQGGKSMEMGYYMPYEDPMRELFIKTAPSVYRHLYE